VILAFGALALAGALAGCGSGGASAATGSGPRALAAATPASCPEAILDTLTAGVLQRVYMEGVSSERTVVARHILRSRALREAVLSGSSAAVQGAARELVSNGHITDLVVTANGRTLASVGPPALAPIRGEITDSSGRPIAAYTTSVWADSGFLSEASGLTGGIVAIRSGGRSLGGSAPIRHAMAPTGTLTLGGVLYEYGSFPAETYPSGAARIYLLRPVSASWPLCGASTTDTVVNTLRHVARAVYAAEEGSKVLTQIQRVESDPALSSAVAAGEPAATTAAVRALLNQHIVRLRVISRGRLLADVGGPFVLAPVTGVLRRHGREIGRFVLSIQDDEGFKRLAGRLAGVRVLMYMEGHLVKNSLGPEPGSVPASGPYEYRGNTYRVFTLHLHAFPSGPLLVRALVPIPYS